MKAGFRTSAQTAILRVVHDHPGVTRAQVAAEVGIPSGFAAEAVARLVASRLVSERSAPSTGRRGRPSTSLRAHPDGPLVAAASITQNAWQVAAVELGGGTIAAADHPHDRDQSQVLDAVAAELDRVRRRFGARVRAAAVAVPGTVVGSTLVHAPGLAWHDVDLSVLWPRYEPGIEFLAGNDATLAGIAESRHGACAGVGTTVYLHLDEGVGGAVIEAGRAVRGSTGAAGEFGHMPFGDPAQRCRCGARGCWNTSLNGDALARLLRQPVADDDAGYLREVLGLAHAGQPGALAASQAVASSVGGGIAGLVNGLDPHLVVLGGLGPVLLDIAGAEVTAAYHDGLMAFRAVPPPPLVPAQLGSAGPLLGAADEGFSQLLTDEGLQAWAA